MPPRTVEPRVPAGRALRARPPARVLAEAAAGWDRGMLASRAAAKRCHGGLPTRPRDVSLANSTSRRLISGSEAAIPCS